MKVILEHVYISVKERAKLDKSWFWERDRFMSVFLNNVIPGLTINASSSLHPIFNKYKPSDCFGETG
jgi:hypothetical protein